MLELIRAAAEVQEVFDRRRWKYCFIGGLAIQKWGQVRLTNDIDLTILTGFGGEEKFIDALLDSFEARIPDARKFALQHRVILLKNTAGVGLDISCAGFPFEVSAIARARKVQVIPGFRLKVCSAEDLIVYKAFANRPIDWLDIEGIIARHAKKKLDWKYVFDQLKPLADLKEQPEIVTKLKDLIREIRDFPFPV